MRTSRNCGSERGTTLLETLIATAICTVVVFALAGLVSMSTRQSRDAGSTVAQATTLAAQKLDQLMALSFSNSQLNAGGNLDSDSTGYVDYLKVDGTATTGTAADRFFTRRWDVVTSGMPASLKQVRVRVIGNAIGTGVRPSVTLGAYKSQE